MLKKSVPLVLMVVLILGVLSACSSKTSNDQPVSSTTTASTDTTTVKIDMNEFSFSQNEIKVKQGEKIHFVLTNSGKYAHDINSEELKIDIDADPGKTTEADWTAPQKAGSYQIICDKPGHADKGMKMTLTIE
ncbi:Uncharacterized copper-binding protein, cupredoxin-like subfamily [Paenibacillus sp. yr247]|uniref:cupredoxin domain-containing protein n=1 Tax=Paenibacillus sp. yr247 TaxID=1761880 RepID=UPI000883A393|nr:cupredoxin domain-containing protein [Paenibacillus sp. yr247]SDO76313.1 Uncharacterized copper-binding protein, cupredoxin-like subfamily [Paenibacillus sp. yr247]